MNQQKQIKNQAVSRDKNEKNIRVVVCGIGNRMRSDDGTGPRIIDELIKDNAGHAYFFDCGLAPENFAGRISKIRPELLILVDACDFNGNYGDVKMIKREEIESLPLSTHRLPIELFIRFIEKNSKTDFIFIGIKPKTTCFGDNLSPECEKSVDTAKKTIKDILSKSGFTYAL